MFTETVIERKDEKEEKDDLSEELIKEIVGER